MSIPAGPDHETTRDLERASIAPALRVLDLAGQGIEALKDILDETFDRTIACIAAVEGRVVVTGMGKSGHVARKIAATLASTGTPGQFVHPGEASHGDLGMITQADAILALSNSGETEELGDIVAFSKLVRAPLIAIVGRAGSALAEAADHALVLPTVAEACPHGLAPTTSTTMMLALGDAIAVTLMERRGFSVDQFHVLHPGGRLGRRFIKVEDVMRTGDALPMRAPEAGMSEVILEMAAKRLGCVGIVDAEGRLVGIITDGDLSRHMDRDLLDRRACEIMTQRPLTIRREALAAEAIGFMNAKQITCLFVLQDQRPIGVISVHDILGAGIA